MYPGCYLILNGKSTNSNLKPCVALWLRPPYPFLLPSDSITAGLEGKTPAIEGNTLSWRLAPVMCGLK